MVFHWSLSDSKFPQVSRTRLRILAVLSNAVVWIVSTRPSTSKSSRSFNNLLVIVPKAPITIGTIVTFMFHGFSILKQGRGTYPSFYIPSDIFSGPPGQQNRQICNFSFFFFSFFFLFFFSFLLIIIRSGLLAGIWWSVCMLKSHRSLYVSFSRTGAGLCIYHLLVWSNLNFWHISQWITLIIIIIIIIFAGFSHQLWQVLVESEGELSQIPRTLLIILANFSSTVVWMLLILLLISYFSRLFFPCSWEMFQVLQRRLVSISFSVSTARSLSTMVSPGIFPVFRFL